MFGEKCVLCGGKLDRNQKCLECGFDNSKSEKNYKLNRSSCDGMPMTHIHTSETGQKEKQEEKEKTTGKSAVKMQNNRTYGNRNTAASGSTGTYRTVSRKKEKTVGKRKMTGVIIGGVILLAGVISQFAERADEIGFWDETDYGAESEYDPYEYVTRQLSESGETFEGQFSQGEYVGGVHIPEGAYTVTGDGDSYLSIGVSDDENMISLYEWIDEDSPVAEDIRIYEGAIVTLSGDAVVRFTSENAQTQQMSSRENPLTEEVQFSDSDPHTAGEEFPAGVYDMVAESGYGGVSLTVYDDSGNQIGGSSVWLYAESDTEKYYRNLVIPEGAVIQVSEGDEMELRLVPSAEIKDDNYLGYYEWN